MNQPVLKDTKPAATEEPTRAVGIFLRVYWMFLGHATLGVSALMIAGHRASRFSIADIVFGVTLPLLIAARYAEVAWYKGETAYGEPATLAHWKRYTAALLAGSAALWGACHAVAYWYTEG